MRRSGREHESKITGGGEGKASKSLSGVEETGDEGKALSMRHESRLIMGLVVETLKF